MKKVRFLIVITILAIAVSAQAQNVPKAASAHGKYNGLIQVLECPRDRSSYGEFNDYGYWGGGSWCGSTGKAGYWVWVYPNWYVWEGKSSKKKSVPDSATVNGKYSGLLQVLKCERDKKSYGSFSDYGYWGGGPWCGAQGKAGYWVWVYPNWYVWGNKKR